MAKRYRIPIAAGVLTLLGVVLVASRARAGGSTNTLPGGGQPDPSQLPPANLRMDYRGQATQPRGIRNNNPGNIKRGSSQWVGKVPYSESTDGTFEQFTYYVYGVRAMIKLLKTYIEGGTNNIAKIINRWAPAADNNNPQAYIGHVVLKTGIPADQTISYSNVAQIKALVRAIADYENGKVNTVSDEVFDYAYSIA